MTVVALAIVFNSANAFLNGYHFVLHLDWYGHEWLTRWNFIAGSLLFALGYYITKRSDRILAGLRTDATDDYQIPRGFFTAMSAHLTTLERLCNGSVGR